MLQKVNCMVSLLHLNNSAIGLDVGFLKLTWNVLTRSEPLSKLQRYDLEKIAVLRYFERT